VTSGNAQPIAVAEADEICLRCHNGDIASREVHPVGRLVNKPGLTMPEDWPAPGNRLGCITCHNPAAEHCKGLDRPEEDPAFLRGYEGGPFTDFCARCHQRTESHRPYNPHTSQLVDGRVNEQSCLLCHQDTPDYKTAKLSDTTNLRSGPIRLCAGCHRYHVGYFQPGHINHDVSAEKRAYMVAFEQDLLPITDEKLKQMAERNPRPQRLPLSENHHIVCSTCHNPHQAGLFPRDSLLAKGAIPADNKDKNKQYRFRGLGKEICRGCHRQ
jgi:nitrate/TMAO reductase-like tetraheme cytochrome c subunit